MAEGGRQESSRIFISYRREDSAGFVRALLGPLRQRFGSDRIFKDTDNIPPGEDFVNAGASSNLARCCSRSSAASG